MLLLQLREELLHHVRATLLLRDLPDFVHHIEDGLVRVARIGRAGSAGLRLAEFALELFFELAGEGVVFLFGNLAITVGIDRLE